MSIQGITIIATSCAFNRWLIVFIILGSTYCSHVRSNKWNFISISLAIISLSPIIKMADALCPKKLLERHLLLLCYPIAQSFVGLLAHFYYNGLNLLIHNLQTFERIDRIFICKSILLLQIMFKNTVIHHARAFSLFTQWAG